MTTRPLHEDDINRVLIKVVDHNGMVDYLSPDLQAMVHDYAKAVEDMDLNMFGPKGEVMAFWINTYNMLMILSIMNEIKKRPKFAKKGSGTLRSMLRFMGTKYKVGGKKRSLTNIFNTLNEEFLDPRVFFVLTLGARSGPPLKRTLYSGEVIDMELDQATHDYINSPLGVILDKEKMHLRISYIFRMYIYHLGFMDGTLAFISRFHDEGDFIFRNMGFFKVKYMKFDWTPNIRDMVLD